MKIRLPDRTYGRYDPNGFGVSASEMPSSFNLSLIVIYEKYYILKKED